jgi:hypothetical protein
MDMPDMKKINPKGRKLDKSGNPIVTMDAVKKAGFTNLRDYLNDKKGLKRRDGKAPERTKEYMAKNMTAPMKGPAVEANPMRKRAAPQKAAPAVKTTPYTGPEGNAGEAEAAKNSPMPRIRSEARMKDTIEEQATKERMDTDPLGMGMKKGGKVKGMHRMPDGKMMKDSAHKKQGGKPAKYSRGGGIAVKGFGKGRMC